MFGCWRSSACGHSFGGNPAASAPRKVIVMSTPEISELGFLHSANAIDYDQHVRDTFQYWYFRMQARLTDHVSDWSVEELFHYASV